MPTQHDFRAAATALRTLATTAGASAVSVNDVGDIGMTGGIATDIVHAAMDAAFLNATAVERSSASAADEFERRATVCATYTTDMRRWRERMETWQSSWTNYFSDLAVDPDAPMPGTEPGRPMRWPMWVEEG